MRATQAGRPELSPENVVRRCERERQDYGIGHVHNAIGEDVIHVGGLKANPVDLQSTRGDLDVVRLA